MRFIAPLSRRNHFNYRPQFKIWLSSNQPVNADPDDDAVWGACAWSNSLNPIWAMRIKPQAPHAIRGSFAGCFGLGHRRRPPLVRYRAPRPTRTGAISQQPKNAQRAELDNVQAWLDETASRPPSLPPSAGLYSSYANLGAKTAASSQRSRRLFPNPSARKGFVHKAAKYQ
jgi:hypothetical protein